MEDEIDLVKETIKSPHPPFIYQDRDFPDRHIYYRLADTRDYYIKVVVKFSDDNIGEVITAFMPDSPKDGEVMLWPG